MDVILPYIITHSSKPQMTVSYFMDLVEVYDSWIKKRYSKFDIDHFIRFFVVCPFCRLEVEFDIEEQVTSGIGSNFACPACKRHFDEYDLNWGDGLPIEEENNS